MSHTKQSPAMIIARKHQSSPSEHYAEKAIKQAAEEIASGRYVADVGGGDEIMKHLGIALGAGTGAVATGRKPSLEDFQETRELNELGEHPRVQEALDRMKREAEELTNPQEIIEMQWRMHETNQILAQSNKWEGQQRWEGEEAKERAQGKLLTPWDFHKRLCEVIGNERVLLSPHVVKPRPDAKSGRVGLYVKNPRYTGMPPITEYKTTKAGKLREEGLAKLNYARKLRAAGLNALANKAFDEAGALAQAATEMYMEASAEVQLAEPELLRVGTLQWPLGTEWMIMAFDRYGVPTEADFLGWRTALLTMVRTQAITEDEANEAFPVDATNEAASWYREQLYWRRNNQVVQ